MIFQMKLQALSFILDLIVLSNITFDEIKNIYLKISYKAARWQKYFNIALVLQDEWLTIFTRPANTCTCPLKAYAINNIRK